MAPLRAVTTAGSATSVCVSMNIPAAKMGANSQTAQNVPGSLAGTIGATGAGAAGALGAGATSGTSADGGAA